MAGTVQNRIQSGVVIDANGCWIWQRCVSTRGYGMLQAYGSVKLAHRVSYTEWRGPIPDGKQIDHLCRVRACVNPDHLEVVTPRTNTLRGIGPTAANAVKTECKRGHPFDEANTYLLPTGRSCRTCAREWRARSRARAGREQGGQS